MHHYNVLQKTKIPYLQFFRLFCYVTLVWSIIQKHFLSFFGSNENFENCFWDLLTFSFVSTHCNIKQDFRIHLLYTICSRSVVYDIFCRNTQSSLLQFTRLTQLCILSLSALLSLDTWAVEYGVMIWRKIARKKV